MDKIPTEMPAALNLFLLSVSWVFRGIHVDNHCIKHLSDTQALFTPGRLHEIIPDIRAMLVCTVV